MGTNEKHERKVLSKHQISIWDVKWEGWTNFAWQKLRLNEFLLSTAISSIILLGGLVTERPISSAYIWRRWQNCPLSTQMVASLQNVHLLQNLLTKPHNTMKLYSSLELDTYIFFQPCLLSVLSNFLFIFSWKCKKNVKLAKENASFR